ncbi:MAG: signal recognition particle-docking protein FtsY [Candidatus Marinimicrobia bacterium]|nr:signal recognition particle-docking protein FtsY [Candidatus Neomarinimicrobiota bacterium]
MSFFDKIFSSITNTRKNISNTFDNLLNIDSLSTEDYESIEECLLSADISWSIVEKTIETIRNENKNSKNWQKALYKSFKQNLNCIEHVKFNKVILMVGVNGVGKTTSCAKIANYFKLKNNKVSLVAADTYRAAAVNQLKLWSDKLKIDFISNEMSSDPASVAFDGVQSGLSKNTDYIIIDTAGRLQNSENLMKELEKIFRVISKLTDDISIAINIDANFGQNSISQIENFSNYVPIDNVILNKMDGTSKGGIVMSIVEKFKLPISFIGTGEKVSDIVEFNFEDYLKSLIDLKEK